MKNILTLILVLFVFSSASGQEYSKREFNYKPKNLIEAVEQLKIIVQDSTKQKILAMTENEFLSEAHFEFGMWIRNKWGLWKGKELADYFNSIGIFHPDDMSGIILTCYYRGLTGKDWKVDEQIQFYKDYWEKTSEHFRRLETDTTYQKMIQAKYDSIAEADLELKKIEWTVGKKVSGFLGYQCRFVDLGETTKIEGTILGWKGSKLLLHIDNYVEENKRKRVIRCNDIKNDTVLIEHPEFFNLE